MPNKCTLYMAAFNGIVTRKETDFKRSKLPVLSPEQAIYFVETKGQ
jgi:hypothetical protein